MKHKFFHSARTILALFAGLILLIAFLSGMTFLPLAAPADASGGNAQEDPMIGVFVTKEYLDLFDMESYLSDHAASLLDAGTHQVSDDTGKYSGRLYATLSGDSPSSLSFEGAEGFSYYCSQEEDVTRIECDELFAKGASRINETDDGTQVELEATLYQASLPGFMTFYCNPIYQAADGSIYATGGQGISTNVDADSAGLSCSTTLQQELKEDGSSRSFSFKITFCVMDEPKSYRLLQMDAQNQVLEEQDYLPGDVPEAIRPLEKASYLILQTFSTKGDGTESATWELFQRPDAGTDATLSTYTLREDRICQPHYTTIQWGG